MQTAKAPKFEISVEGKSRVTILKCDDLPIARFYAGRASDLLLQRIERKLNALGPGEWR